MSVFSNNVNHDGESLEHLGLSVENLKRANAVNANLSNLKFPVESEFEIVKAILRKKTNDCLVEGDLKISC